MSTRSESFTRSRSRFSEQQYEIKKLLEKEPMSIWQLANAMHTESHCITHAVSTLKTAGKIEEVGKFFNEETKRHQTLLALAKPSTIPKRKKPKTKLDTKTVENLKNLLKFLSQDDPEFFQRFARFNEAQNA